MYITIKRITLNNMYLNLLVFSSRNSTNLRTLLVWNIADALHLLVCDDCKHRRYMLICQTPVCRLSTHAICRVREYVVWYKSVCGFLYGREVPKARMDLARARIVVAGRQKDSAGFVLVSLNNKKNGSKYIISVAHHKPQMPRRRTTYTSTT